MPQVIGMPFLDLICCAFGGIILLYLLASRDDGTPTPVLSGMRVYIAETGGSNPHRLGMRLIGPKTDSACWPPQDCDGGLWEAEPGMTVGMVKTPDPMDCVLVAMTEPHRAFELPDEIAVRLSSPGSKLDKNIKLRRGSGYRAQVPDPDGSRGC